MAERHGSGVTVPEDRLAVWPFAALVLAAAVTLFGYAAMDGPPAWLTRTVIVIVGATPSGGHAVHIGLALLLLARGLHVRRLMALYLTAAAVLWSALMSLLTWDQPWRLVPMAAFAWALWGARTRFSALPDPARLRTAFHLFVGLVVVAFVVGGGGLFLQRGRLSGSLTPVGLGRELFDGLTANPGPMTLEGRSWFLHGLTLLGGITLLAVLACVLAPAPAPRPGGETERDRVRRLVQHPDSDTLAPFALRHDKSYVFSPDGRAAIGYRVFLGTAVVGGDPVGAADAREAAVAEFLALCRRRGWRPAVLGAREALLPLWREHGMREIGIGDEVMLDVAGFSLEGRSIRNVRQAVRRTHKAGITTKVLRETALDGEAADQLLAIHQRWLKGHAEHGFAMNLDAITSARHPDALLIVAYDAAGTAVGFQRYHPVGADRPSGTPTALSLDVMPRDPTSPNGVNERLIVDLVAWARDRGVTEISLNFAAFRPVMDAGSRRTPLERLAYRAIHLLDPWIMLESLYRFNAKFRPGWQPRSVLFRSWGEVAWLAVAALAMEFSMPLDRHRVAPVGDRVRGRGRRHGTVHDEVGDGIGDEDAIGGAVRRRAG
ncbi:bifunctional lysylphosphatidylglycerol flippase/synthetase MprF [Catenulispora subtropica]|uniref:Phosphatidylglycerol lysyltransferase C-terminal domain-containing protein n=1 Tax=Catenulispora subtropica TaxID=450798 RepID=A0ABP5CDQ6_9ACTN